MKLRRTLLVAGVMLFLGACSTPPKRPLDVTRHDLETVKAYAAALIRHEMAKNEIAAMSIALVDDQRVVWAEGFGYADKESGRPATAATIYRVGSISKLFAATAAMQLVEQHKIDLDRPLHDVLPEFSIRSAFAESSPISPRQLMTHHAGLPRDFSKGMFAQHPEPFTELVHHVRDLDAAYPPNHVFSYSNIGVTLLGHAIQNVTGVPFAEHLQHSLFEPLDMRTAAFASGLSASDLMAKPYRAGKLAEEPSLRDLPAGGLNASVLDLSRFLSMVFAGGRVSTRQVLRPESIQEMLRPQNTDVELDFNFHNGLGWMLSALSPRTIQNAGIVAHHAGATIHYRAQLYALPEHKLGVVVLANSASAQRSVDRVALDTLALALEAKTGIKQANPEPTQTAEAPWRAETLQAYVGQYTSQFGYMRVYLDGSTLRAQAFGRTFKLVPRGDGRLGLEYRLLGLLPIDLGELNAIGVSLRHVAGRDVLVATVGAQDMLLGERVRPGGSAPAWHARVGRYEIVNAANELTLVQRIALTEEDGVFIAEIQDTMLGSAVHRLVLQPISDSAARILGPLGDGGSMIRCQAASPGGEHCETSGYVLRRTAE